MKTISQKMLFLLIVSLIITSCKKEAEVDYRDVYTGNWRFITVRTAHYGVEPSVTLYDSTLSVGIVKKGPSANELTIRFLPDDSITLAIGTDGKLSNFPTQYCNGEFTDNSKLHLFLRYGGLGNYSQYQIEGNK